MKYIKNGLFLSLAMLASFLLFIPIGVQRIFGDIELESIIFHIFMPKIDMSFDWLRSLTPYIIAFLFTLIIFSFVYIRFKKTRIILWGLVLGILCFDGYYLDQHFQAAAYLVNQRQASNFIAHNYTDPRHTHLQFPEQKRNLIFIQVESLEASLQDKNNGGLLKRNYIPELTELAKENINFSSNDKVGGAIVLPEAGWTMGGLIAETAGIPLKYYRIHRANDQVGNKYGEYKSFLKNVISLGDILRQARYKNYFILGSAAGFAAQNVYLKNHGDYEIFDHDIISHEMNVQKPKENWWGLLDQDVYAFAKKKLIDFSKEEQPFSLLIQTIDSHRDGFLSPDCPKLYKKRIKNVYACVSSQLNDFISWCRQQDFFANTTIVIVGDHCSMSTTLFNKHISKETGYYEGTDRTVYNAFINSAVAPHQEKYRLFSTFDIFPTTLAAMGVTIEGDRLGLGTNLFSAESTLLEKYSYRYLHDELRKKSNFYNRHLLYAK